MKEEIQFLVEGGKASSAIIAPKIASYKLNVNEVLEKVNEKTREYIGMEIPVKLIIDKEKKIFEVEVGVPPISSLIKKELGIEKAKISEEDKAKGITSVGDLKMEQVIKIAKMKRDSLLVKDLKNAVKMVLGSIVSMPITVEGKKVKEIIKEVDEGKWDEIIK
ncbi:MAG: 50S ribosomal protein L11 [Candidatus Aenigmatarchaeota archaeon]